MPACDDNRLGNIGRWLLKCLEKQLAGLGCYSNCNSGVRNLRFCPVYGRTVSQDVSFLFTNSLNITPLQKDYPTDCTTVIESLYWKAAPERIVNQKFYLSYLFYETLLVELCGLCRDRLTVPSNCSFEAPRAAFWSVFVTWRKVKKFSSTLTLRWFTRELLRATVQSTKTKQFRILSKLNVTNPKSKNTQYIAVGYPLFYMIVKGKAVLLQAWNGPECSRKLR